MIILNIRMLLLFKLAYVCRWSKIFFFRVCIKEGDVITFWYYDLFLTICLPLRRIILFVLYLFPQSYIQGHQWSCTISAGWNIPWIYPSTIPFQYLKMVFANEYSTHCTHYSILLLLAKSQFIFLKRNGLIWDLKGKFR